jgi:hypothetical protein
VWLYLHFTFSFRDCVSTLTPLSPVAELLIARLGRDDLDLGGRQHDSAELEAPATGLVDDLRTVRCDVAQGVDLVVVLPIRKGSDIRRARFRSPASHSEGAPSHRRG